MKTLLHVGFLAVLALVLARMLTVPLIRRALVSFFVLSAATATLAIVQAIDQNVVEIGLADSLGLLSRTSNGFVRPNAVFTEPAYLGYASVAGGVIGLWLYSVRRSWWVAAGLAACVAGVLLAASAGPIVAAIPVVVYVFWRAAPELRRLLPSFAAAAAVGVAVVVFVPAGSTIIDRADAIVSGSDASAELRYEMNRASIDIWQLAPVTGVGLGNTRHYMPSLIDLSFIPNAHYEFNESSAYLAALAECGPLGLIALITFLVSLLVPISAYRSFDWVTTAPILMFTVAFFFIGGLLMPAFWLWVSLRLALANQARERARIAPVESPSRLLATNAA
jgi:O-antigen ligase